MILNEKTKHDGTRFGTLVLALLGAVVLGSVFGAAQVGRAQAGDEAKVPATEAKKENTPKLDHINFSHFHPLHFSTSSRSPGLHPAGEAADRPTLGARRIAGSRTCGPRAAGSSGLQVGRNPGL